MNQTTTKQNIFDKIFCLSTCNHEWVSDLTAYYYYDCRQCSYDTASSSTIGRRAHEKTWCKNMNQWLRKEMIQVNVAMEHIFLFIYSKLWLLINTFILWTFYFKIWLPIQVNIFCIKTSSACSTLRTGLTIRNSCYNQHSAPPSLPHTHTHCHN